MGRSTVTATTDVIRICFVNNRLLFLHSRKCETFAIIFFMIFVGEELTVFGFLRG